VKGVEGDGGREAGRGGTDGARGASAADGGEGDGEFDQTATAEGVAERAFPGDERRVGEGLVERGGFEAAGFEGAGAVTFEPDAATGGGGGQVGEAGGEARAVGAVGGEVVHLVVQALAGEGE